MTYKTRFKTLLSLAFILLTTACGGYTGDPPSPPRAPLDPSAGLPVAKAAAPRATVAETARRGAASVKPQRAQTSSRWYERYDLGDGEVTVIMNDGTKEAMSGGDRPRYRRESYENPGLAAYKRRLAVLRREQKRLLAVNAQLRKELRPNPNTAAQLRELREMQRWLAQLSAGQAAVMAQTRAVTEAHGALLAQLKTLPEQLAQLEQP